MKSPELLDKTKSSVNYSQEYGKAKDYGKEY
jgi:hypothetical protein